MSSRGNVVTLVIAEDSPSSASTVAGTKYVNLAVFDYLIIDATLTGATGGTLDVYIQREVGVTGSSLWLDWYHFTQVGASASAATYTLTSDVATTATTTVGSGTSPALTAGILTSPTPAGRVRLVFTAGASTSAGATQTVRFTGWKSTS
jgi:hypothetical protein